MYTILSTDLLFDIEMKFMMIMTWKLIYWIEEQLFCSRVIIANRRQTLKRLAIFNWAIGNSICVACDYIVNSIVKVTLSLSSMSNAHWASNIFFHFVLKYLIQRVLEKLVLTFIFYLHYWKYVAAGKRVVPLGDVNLKNKRKNSP